MQFHLSITAPAKNAEYIYETLILFLSNLQRLVEMINDEINFDIQGSWEDDE